MIITQVNTEEFIVARAIRPPGRFLVLPAAQSTFLLLATANAE